MNKKPIVITRENFWKLDLSEIQSTYLPKGKKITDLPVYPPRECSWCKHAQPTWKYDTLSLCLEYNPGKEHFVSASFTCFKWSQKES